MLIKISMGGGGGAQVVESSIWKVAGLNAQLHQSHLCIPLHSSLWHQCMNVCECVHVTSVVKHIDWLVDCKML